MKAFAQLIKTLDEASQTNAKLAALSEYFKSAAPEDRVWCIAIFSGRRPPRGVTTAEMRIWAAEAAELPLWLLENTYHIVGDLAETISLLLPPAQHKSTRTLQQWIQALLNLKGQDLAARKGFMLSAWTECDGYERFVFNKLITGGFRIGVSQKLMTRALAQATGQDAADLAHKLMGQWNPEMTSWEDLILAQNASINLSRPYPFCLAHALDTEPTKLGDISEWSAEWKWDGIRAQVVVREKNCFIWSRGEEMVNNQFPELAPLAEQLPHGTVIDGELLAWADDKPLPFHLLQKRLGRKTVPASLLKSAPIRLLAYDLLEEKGSDIRAQPFAQRRSALEALLQTHNAQDVIIPSRSLPAKSWGDLATYRADARSTLAEGLMIKSRQSPYIAGRKKGHWWKWKLDPRTIDGVMIYAQAGHGRRANLYTDFTFAVWDGPALVPFTKAYSGLSDAEFRKITAWVRKNTLQRFGPVRQVTPQHVFEIAFEGIQESTRHKSGIALRFPRMARWRGDKKPEDANTLADLKEMLHVQP